MTTFSRSPARLKGLAALVIGGLALSACATTPMGGSAVGPAVFNADDFAWSTRAGQASIEGRVAFAQDGRVFQCAGNVGLIPEWRRRSRRRPGRRGARPIGRRAGRRLSLL